MVGLTELVGKVERRATRRRATRVPDRRRIKGYLPCQQRAALCGNTALRLKGKNDYSGRDNSNGRYYFALLFYDPTLPRNRYAISYCSLTRSIGKHASSARSPRPRDPPTATVTRPCFLFRTPSPRFLPSIPRDSRSSSFTAFRRTMNHPLDSVKTR